MRRSSLATYSAARWTSDLCSGRVLMLGMRSRSFNSLRKRCWFWRAKATAGDAMGKSFLDDDFPQYSETERPIHHGDTEAPRTQAQKLSTASLNGFAAALRSFLLSPCLLGETALSGI